MPHFSAFSKASRCFKPLLLPGFLIGFLLSSLTLSARLYPGDIAFVGMNTDGSHDRFAFLALVDIPDSETIYFTDAGWDVGTKDFRPGETSIGFTIPIGGISKGTVTTLSLVHQLSNLGDQVTAYQESGGEIFPLASINNFGNSYHANAVDEHTSAVPKDLSETYTAVSVGSYDNLKYNGPTTGTHSFLLQIIHDPQFWTGSNSYTQSFSGMSFTILPGGPAHITTGDVQLIDEGSNQVQLDFYSSSIGSHTATLQLNGGTAQSGQDFQWSGPVNLDFTSSRHFTHTLTLTDDSDCEALETIQFQLSSVPTVELFGPNQTISLRDNDANLVTFFQGFESSGAGNWSYTHTPGAYNSETGSTPWHVTGNEEVWDRIQSFSNNYFAPEGDYFWGMQGINNTNAGGSFYHTLVFDAIDLTGITNAALSFDYFTYNSSAAEEIQYAVEFNNGTNWGSLVTLPYNSNGWNTEVISIPPTATHVRLLVQAKETSGILCGGLDQVRVTGGLCPSNYDITVQGAPTAACIGLGDTAWIPFTSTGNFTPGNTFTVELSDANGNFGAPVVIGSLAAFGIDPSGTIPVLFPAGVAGGNGYRIRIVSSSPAVTSPDNGADITLNSLDATLTPFVYSNGSNFSCPSSMDGMVDLQVLSGTAPYTFSWTGPNGFTASSEDISGLAAGAYTVYITDAGGCNISRSIILSQPYQTLHISINPISCHNAGDGSLTAVSSGWGGGQVYNWTGPNGFTATGPVISNLDPGLYVVTLSDSNGCIRSDSTSLVNPSPLSLSLNSPTGACGHEISCFGANDGEIDLTITGGTFPYNYAWTGPGGFTATNPDPSGLAPGTYSVQVTDIRGCTIAGSITLSEPPPLSANVEALSFACGFGVTCHGASDGTAFVVGESGGCPPYTYQWSNGQTISSATGLAADVPYSVTITDANGCATVRSVTLSQPGPLTVAPVVTEASCDDAGNGAILLPSNGGCLPHTITWTGPNGFTGAGIQIDSLFAGAYTYTLVDGNGCTISGTLNVEAENDLAASLGCCQDTVVCAGALVAVEVDLFGTGPHEITYLQNGDTLTTILNDPNQGILNLTVNESTTIELLSVVSPFTGCTGTVCGRVTIGVNDCSGSCADLCVNAGVISVQDNGFCRTVTMEVACDTLCSTNVSECPGTQVVSFNQFPDGSPIPAGTVVGNQWASMGVTFSFVNNNPNKVPTGVIFDSSNPTGGDWDLGTPNSDFGGPGIGPGGVSGTPGENSVALGNLLILAENTVDADNDGLIDDPDDEAAGGEMQMNFAFPYYVESLSMVDLDNGNGIIRVHQTGNRTTDFNIPGLGDNAVTTIPIQLDSVVQMRVILPSSGGISALAYCPVAPGFVDVSIPCGSVSSVSNDAGLVSEIISQDSITGITGVRIYGLPSDCIDSTGQAGFHLTYEVCGLDSSCASSFCLPLVAYHRNGCVQYETSVNGPVSFTPSAAPAKDPDLERLGAVVNVYPNPVGAEAKASIYLPEGGFVVAEVYSLDGQRVRQIFSGEVDAEETREADFNMGGLPGGMYLLRVVTGEGEVLSKKFVLSRY